MLALDLSFACTTTWAGDEVAAWALCCWSEPCILFWDDMLLCLWPEELPYADCVKFPKLMICCPLLFIRLLLLPKLELNAEFA